MTTLYNNSVNCFTTRVEDKDSKGKVLGVIDVTEFTEATYRVFAGDKVTPLIECKLSTGEIIVEDSTYNGVDIKRFKTLILKDKILDTVLPAGKYQHQMKVINADGYELPPVFQGDVTVIRAHEPEII